MNFRTNCLLFVSLLVLVGSKSLIMQALQEWQIFCIGESKAENYWQFIILLEMLLCNFRQIYCRFRDL